MKLIKNEKGSALAISLGLGVVALIIIAYLFSMSQKREVGETEMMDDLNSETMVEDGDAMMENKDDSMMVEDDSAMMEEDDSMMEEDDSMMEEDDSMMEEEGSMMESDDSAMMEKSGEYVDYSDETYTKAAGDKRVLFFHATWCPTCKVANASFLENKEKIPAGVSLLKTDYDKENELKDKYEISYQHTFVQVDENGNEIAKWNGGGIDELLANLK